MPDDVNRRLGVNTGHFGASHFPVIGPLARWTRKTTKRMGWDITVRTMPPKDAIHFLHIGKAAGTTMMGVIDRINADAGKPLIIRREHDVRLRDLPEDARYVFSIRDPISRFVSGFYSRHVENRPSLHSPWIHGEATVFAHYRHATQLAEDLFEPGEAGRRAVEAMCSLVHAPSQIGWFAEGGQFLSERPPVWIIRQENFETDLSEFLATAGLRDYTPRSRSNAAIQEREPLSDKARANLERWYAADIAFCRVCNDWLNSQRSVRPGGKYRECFSNNKERRLLKRYRP